MKKEYPVIEVPSDGKPNWSEGARCMCFVYSKTKGNFILKGYVREVKNFLKKNYTHYFYYFSMWNNGKSRGFWNFWKEDVSIFEPRRAFKTKKFRVVKYERNSYTPKRLFEMELKRLPKHWIPEFDNL